MKFLTAALDRLDVDALLGLLDSPDAPRGPVRRWRLASLADRGLLISGPVSSPRPAYAVAGKGLRFLADRGFLIAGR